jgi:hypothetical protein
MIPYACLLVIDQYTLDIFRSRLGPTEDVYLISLRGYQHLRGSIQMWGYLSTGKFNLHIRLSWLRCVTLHVELSGLTGVYRVRLEVI